jgi:hypothetical protein
LKIFKLILGGILALTGIVAFTALGALATFGIAFVGGLVLLDPSRLGAGPPSLFTNLTVLWLGLFSLTGPIVGFVLGIGWARGLFKD